MIAYVFPGQGSQRPGMGADLPSTIFDAVSDAVDRDIRALCQTSDEETLRQTDNAQIALFTCGIAAFTTLEKPDQWVTAGHSVGEYAALVAAGVLSVADGARAVQKRGELMASAGALQPGTMAAVLGLDRDSIQAVLDATPGTVVIANDNCPGQLVISGEVAAVKAAAESLSAAGAKRVLPLYVSGAFHSPLMDEPAREMAAFLAGLEFREPIAPIYANVTAQPEASGWPDRLVEQLKKPVRWTETVQNMVADGVTHVTELGGGEVLLGLLKRIDKSIPGNAVQ
jgi:[acyl-carrier-protein] S-malonyltransferase